MINTYRGEVTIELDDKIYNMRPTFQALCAIEHAIGKSLLLLLSKLDEQGILLSEQLAIIKLGIKHGDNIKLPDNLEELIKKKGAANILAITCKFLEQGLGL